MRKLTEWQADQKSYINLYTLRETNDTKWWFKCVSWEMEVF